MSFEIDSFNFDLTRKPIKGNKQVRALLIIDRKTTAKERKEIIEVSGLTWVRMRMRVPEEIKNAYLIALNDTFDDSAFDKHHYYIGYINDYDELFGQLVQIKFMYNNIIVKCYRVLEGEQFALFEKAAALITKFHEMMEQLHKVWDEIEKCAAMKGNLKPFVEAVTSSDSMTELQNSIPNEWAYTYNKFLDIFDALDLGLVPERNNP